MSEPARSASRVVAITGASGGIGRAAAVEFARRGDRVALLARGEAGLLAAAEQVGRFGVDWLLVEVDVADPDQVEAAVEQVEDRLGPIDVWVNVAFSSVFARFDDVTPEEYRRATEVSYLGYVYATMSVLRRMKARDAGTIVHVGSALAYRGIPLQTAYCGAKHAIQGFHEALRCELLHEHSRVHVTMVQMPAVNTPQFSWLLSRLPQHAQPVPPIYQPEVAARAIVYAADHPRRREYWVGASTVGHPDRQRGRAGPARPVPGPDRVRLPADRNGETTGPAGEPVGAGGRPRRARLRGPRRLRRPRPGFQPAAVGRPPLPPARWRRGRRDGRDGGRRSRAAGPRASAMNGTTGRVRLAGVAGAIWGATLLLAGPRIWVALTGDRPNDGRPARGCAHWVPVISARECSQRGRPDDGTAGARRR